MADVIRITEARNFRQPKNTHSHVETYKVSVEYEDEFVDSQVSNLIGLLEPILDSVKNDQNYDAANDVQGFINALELSRREIDQLEDMAIFILEVNKCKSN
jgi:hypothetical protein